MKKTLLTLGLSLLGALSLHAAKKSQPLVNRIDPANWYVGMKNPNLQLMVYGKDIRDAEVTIDYAGVTIERLVRLDSPNYLLVYLNVADAQPGTVPLTFVKGKQRQLINYELRTREMPGTARHGFTNADVLYMLMPDRFASAASVLASAPVPAASATGSPVPGSPLPGIKSAYRIDRTAPSLRHGGNLEGVRQHLDYFNELGVTALWFTPVLENDSPDHGKSSTYHGYATTDYYRVDPRFGTNADYRRLTDEAHQKGLKVVMDMIFNHCGFDHPWVADMPSHDWFNTPEWLSEKAPAPAASAAGTPVPGSPLPGSFLQTSYKLTPTVDPYVSKIDLHETVDGWFVRSMPDLNQRNEHVMTYLIQNSFWWIETIGIDGIRMDTYPYADAKGMATWMKQLNEEYPNYNVVGESWVTEPAFTAALQKDSHLKAPLFRDSNHSPIEGVGEGGSYLNTVMDFSFFDRINQAKDEETDDWWKGLNRIYNTFVYDYLYANPSNVMAFLDNHDTDRFLGKGKDLDALKQGLAILLTVNRIPQIYYGTEILMNGTKEITDGYVRCDFPGGFPGDKENKFTREGRTLEENAAFDWLSNLLHWRKGNALITKGTMTQFIPYNGIYVIARQHEGRTALTIVNGRNSENTLGVARYAEVINGTSAARDVLTDRTIALTQDITLAPREVLILEY